MHGGHQRGVGDRSVTNDIGSTLLETDGDLGDSFHIGEARLHGFRAAGAGHPAHLERHHPLLGTRGQRAPGQAPELLNHERSPDGEHQNARHQGDNVEEISFHAVSAGHP